MKKLNGKLVISALLAAAVMSASSAAVGAVDYSDEGAPKITVPTQAAVLKDSDVSNAVTAAVSSGATEIVFEMEKDVSGAVTVQEAAIAEIAKSTVAVTVEVTSENSDVDYYITIDPALIKDAKAINLAMEITVDPDRESEVSGVEVPTGAVMIEPAQKGDFGMTLQVNLPAAAVEKVDLDTAALYYIKDSGEVERMPDSALVINSDGSVTIAISHASAYVISDIDLTLDNAEDVTENDDSKLISEAEDINPGTGAAIALGALAVSAAAAAFAVKRRK